MKKATFLLLTILLIMSCGSPRRINQDPYYDSFFLKARIIMTKSEAQIYKHLPDQKAREEFIEEFWTKRDPTPETEINENKEEFEKRVEYANRWFNEGKGGHSRGWDSQRGRIFILLGHPERREMGDWTPRGYYGQLLSTKRTPIEIWYYHYHQLRLFFVGDEFGTFKLERIPPALGTALERVKYTLDFAGAVSAKHKFKFSVSYKKNQLFLKIPTDKISFEVGEKNVEAQFEVQIFVYEGYKKVETVTRSISLKRNKDQVLNKKNVILSIPYRPLKKGSYYLDVIVRETATSFKYRDYVKFRI